MDLPPFRFWQQGQVTIASSSTGKGDLLPESVGLRGLVDQGTRRLVLDLSGIRFLGSAVLGHLIHLVHRLRQVNGRLFLCCPEPDVFEVFRITRLNAIMPVYSTLSEAIQAANGEWDIHNQEE